MTQPFDQDQPGMRPQPNLPRRPSRTHSLSGKSLTELLEEQPPTGTMGMGKTLLRPLAYIWALIILFPVLVLDAFVLKTGWNWFIGPHFGVEGMNWTVSMAIILLLGMLLANAHNAKVTNWATNGLEELKMIVTCYLAGIQASALILFALWILHIVT